MWSFFQPSIVARWSGVWLPPAKAYLIWRTYMMLMQVSLLEHIRALPREPQLQDFAEFSVILWTSSLESANEVWKLSTYPVFKAEISWSHHQGKDSFWLQKAKRRDSRWSIWGYLRHQKIKKHMRSKIFRCQVMIKHYVVRDKFGWMPDSLSGPALKLCFSLGKALSRVAAMVSVVLPASHGFLSVCHDTRTARTRKECGERGELEVSSSHTVPRMKRNKCTNAFLHSFIHEDPCMESICQ